MKFKILLVLQLVLILIAGIASKDMGFAITVSLIGVAFNFLVSINNPVGFLFGVAYALANGMLAYESHIYATFVFMVFIQAPMAVYSFLNWKKKKESTQSIMKTMTSKQQMLLGGSMLALGVVMYFVLQASNSTSVLLDTIFFVFSVSACFLLAFCYKNAYLITLMSGLGGVVLWTYQMVQTGNGFSVATFYMIVSINSIIAVYEQYFEKTSLEA